MVNWHLQVCRLVILCLVMILISSQLLFAKRDTVLLTFQKVAVPKERTQTYMVKKGDWIIDIIRRQLNVKGIEAFKTVRLVKQLNPRIRNLNRIYPGQVLKLPGGDIPVANQEVGLSKAGISATKEYTREKPVIPQEIRLAIIRHVISRMNGSIMTTGNYYIPLSPMGQTTIACSKIPLVELDDGSVILLDFSNRIPEYLGKMIRASWKNYHLVKATSHDDIAYILQKIINVSSLYTMNKRLQPFIMGGNPQIRLLFDWMITKSTPPGSKPYLQGISFVTEESHLLPKSLITYAEKKGLIITEIMDGSSVINVPDVTYTIPEIPIIGKTTQGDMVCNLLTTLGYLPVRDADVKIFDMVNDGFNLSIKADLIVKNGDKQVMIHSKKLPQQFINILRDGGTEVAFIEEGDVKRSAVEKTLHTMNIPFSYQSFSFSIPEKTDKARATITFPAIKITTEDKGDLYMLDFDMDREIYGLLHDKWEVNAVRY
ncbi:MAG: LysM domain-containing protein [Syntrophales bacterium]|nr:LysM domain-containing protein [Syntrophales bacterium]